MTNPCIHHKCVHCCLKTAMSLLENDIERLKRKGFEAFFIVNHDGWLQLKNKDGKCIFNDGNQCLIYEYRPEGCKSYPIIYDDDADCAILDEECPYKHEFKISKRDIVLLRTLIKKLDNERKDRGN